MELLTLAVWFITIFLAGIIFVSATFNLYLLSASDVPIFNVFYNFKRVLIIRNVLSVLVAAGYFFIHDIITAHSTVWYLVFHYLFLLLIYVDTCVIRVYLKINELNCRKRYT